MTDVLLFQTDDNGDINIDNGIVELTGSFETAAYLSLFGGNEEDAGGSDRTLQYWADIDETVNSRKYISQTQNLLNRIPLTSSNLLRIEDAARQDLQWFIDENIANSVEIEASVIGLNKLKLDINIQANGEESNFSFTENWKASV